jgi:gas vesicle protein
MSGSDDYRGYDSAGESARWLAVGFGLGLLIGGALGLLLAPKSGRETRENIRGMATDLSSRAKTMANDLGEKTRTTYGQVTDQARTRAGDVAQKVRGVTETARSTVTSARDAAGRAFDAAKKGYRRKVSELEGSGDFVDETPSSSDETN